MPRGQRLPIAVLAAVSIVCTGALASAYLYALHHFYRQSLHVNATRTTLDAGRLMVLHLMNEPAVRAAAEDRDWNEFGRVIRTLQRLEEGLQYVSVSEGDLILYHQDLSGPAGRRDLDASEIRVKMGRELVASGKEITPVLTFVGEAPSAEGHVLSIRVGIRKDTVAREESGAYAALRAMFRVALLTITLSFAVCVVLVAWLIQREIGRERLRREQEHLTFAGALANGILHDFRNPMSALRLDLQMLQKEVEKGAACRSDRLTELSVRTRKTLERMDEILREFLYLSRPDSTSQELVDLNECVRDSVGMLGPGYAKAGVRLETNLSEKALHVRGHGSSLRRVLINLLVNAQQASHAGGTVFVRAYRQGRAAVVEVLDQGPGVSERDRKRIFDMFVSRRPGGLGLGLALAKQVVEGCGGRVGVAAGPQGGALFAVRLPLVEKPEDMLPFEPASRAEQEPHDVL